MISLNVLRHPLGWLPRAAAAEGSPARPGRQPCPTQQDTPRPRPAHALMPDGRVYADALELPIVRHCNLSCRSCTHASPLAKAHAADVVQIEADLKLLAKHFHARRVRLMGGEPLLHPRLIEILQIARRSGIADKVRVVTNGVLLPRQDEPFWRHLDEVELSVYPGRELGEQDLAACRARAAAHGVPLELKYFDRFRESYAELGTADDTLVRRIYRTCNIAHTWSCHNLDDGYFYKCPESLMLPLLLETADLDTIRKDGLKLEDSPAFARRLLDYLDSREPLNACRFCLGTVGRLFDHEELSRKTWRDPQRRTTEELLDRAFLEVLEHERPGAPWLCTRGDVTNEKNRELVERLGLR